MSDGSCFYNRTPSRESDLQKFLDDIPVGMQKCKNDDFFTILDANQGFLSLIGYTKEEIHSIFHDHYIEMIYAEDLNNVTSTIGGQLKTGDQTELEYRILCKDGTLRWILDKGNLIADENGEEIFYCALTDITTLHETREQLRLSLERHEIILNQTNDIIFEFDISSDFLTFSSNWGKKFGYPPLKVEIKKNISHSHIHPKDIPTFLKLLEKAGLDLHYATAEVRIKNADGKYIWCRVRGTNQFDEKGRPVKVIGVITDIDDEKRTMERLRSRAEHDSLTGLYDKAALEEKIEDYLSAHPNTPCAFFMVDVDDFKSLNDIKGHLFGDSVLSELSVAMRHEIRSSDLAGRIGGDEFAFFLKDVPSEAFCIQRAEQLMSTAQNLFDGQTQMVKISCSIGISLFPDHGRTFHKLYECADIALYQAKRKGKNRCEIFCKNMSISGISKHRISEIQIRDTRFPGLVEYIFQTLYSSNNLNKAVSMALEIIGQHFEVNRVYVIEISPDSQTIHNSFEWFDNGACPVKERMQDMGTSLLGDFSANINGSGVFYCSDITSLPEKQRKLMEEAHISSILQCALWQNGMLKGYIQISECSGHRLWTKEEISTLAFLSEVISIFLFHS